MNGGKIVFNEPPLEGTEDRFRMGREIMRLRQEGVGWWTLMQKYHIHHTDLKVMAQEHEPYGREYAQFRVAAVQELEARPAVGSAEHGQLMMRVDRMRRERVSWQNIGEELMLPTSTLKDQFQRWSKSRNV